MNATAERIFFGLVRFARVTAVVAVLTSVVAVILTGKAQLLLFSTFAVACGFYTDEVLTKRDVAEATADIRSRIVLAG